MGECGCTSNDDHYWFPAPKNQVYVLTISGGCTDCCVPPGITIELISKNGMEWKEREWWITGELQFADWGYKKGAAVVTGFDRHDFIAALRHNLIGVDSRELGESGKIDAAGADVILEEMYEDAMFRPRLVEEVSPELNTQDAAPPEA